MQVQLILLLAPENHMAMATHLAKAYTWSVSSMTNMSAGPPTKKELGNVGNCCRKISRKSSACHNNITERHKMDTVA